MPMKLHLWMKWLGARVSRAFRTGRARVAGLVALALTSLGVVWGVLAQGATPMVVGSYLELGGQVLAPAASPTLYSTYDLSGNDEIRWTTYFQARFSEPSQVSGVQELPSGHTWLAGQSMLPSKLTMEYKVGGSWQTTEPASGAAVTDLRWTLAPMLTVNFGNVGGVVDFTGTGDGFRIIPYKDRFYVVNHHASDGYLNCRLAVGGVCPGFPSDGTGYSFQRTTGAALPVSSGGFWTPEVAMEGLNRSTGELFFGVQDTTNGMVSIVCTNLDALTGCGVHTLEVGYWEDAPLLNMEQVGDKYYVMTARGTLHCFNVATKASCGTTTYPLMNNTVTTGGPLSVGSTQLGSRMFFGRQNGVWCHDTSTNAPCTGWTTAGKTPYANGGVYPVLNTDGSPKGVCSFKAANCYALNGTSFVPSANLVTFLTNYAFAPAGWWGYAADTNAGAVLGTKAYNAGTDGTSIGCFDFATDAMCPGYPNYTTLYGEGYTTRFDPTRPGCLLSLGDEAKAIVFDVNTLGACGGGGAGSLILDVDPVNDYMRCDPARTHVSSWDKVRISPTVAWGGGGGLSSVKITLMDGTGAMLPAALNPVRYLASGSYSLDISDVPFSSYPRLKVKLEFAGAGSLISSGTMGADLTWKGDPMQWCVPTKTPAAAGCETASKVTAKTALVSDAVGTVRETLTASKLFSPGGGSGGYAAGSTVSTTLRGLGSSLGGTDDRSVVLQGRYTVNGFGGDMWGFVLGSNGQIDVSSVNKMTASMPAAASRTMYMGKPDTGSSLAGAQNVVALQYANADSGQQSALNTSLSGATDTKGSARLSYLRGDNSGGGFRSPPTGLLGPVYGSGPMVLARRPAVGLSESQHPGWTAYRATLARSAPLVLWGGNDGALHAASVTAGGLSEAWAYVPDVMLRRTWAYSDPTLAGIRLQPYFVDNVPMVGHANFGSDASPSWGAAAVITYGRGARAITVLDVSRTDLNNGRGAIEYTHATPGDLDGDGKNDLIDLGYIVSAPIWTETGGSQQIVKMPDGRWAVLVGNGVNSNLGPEASSGTGKAVLYAFYLDAQTPRWRRWAVDEKVSGTAAEKAALQFGNGLSTPRPVDVDGDGRVDVVYAGDIQGNLWRFDMKSGVGSVGVTRLYRTDAGQPIYAAPLAWRNPAATGCAAGYGCWQVVFGTGDFQSPLTGTTNRTAQVLVGLLDKGQGTTVTQSSLDQQVLVTTAGTGGVEFRFTQSDLVSYSSSRLGWFIQLSSGEHVSGAPRVASNGQVLFTAVKPVTAGASSTSCSPARNWLFQLHPLTGSPSMDTFDYNNDGTVDSNDRAKAGALQTARAPVAVAIAGAAYSAPSLLSDRSNASSGAGLMLSSLGQEASLDGTSFAGGAVSGAAATARGSTLLRTGDAKSIGRMSWREVQ